MIGEVTMKGHYQQNAVEQREVADKWRRAAVWASVATVAVAVTVVVMGIFADDPKWYEVVSQAGVTVTVASIATYLGRQSLSHRRREEQYRALELELATLDPFLNSLEPTERNQIKALLAKRYFAGIRDVPTNARVLGEVPMFLRSGETEEVV